ncbi:hypothetical protein [Phytoactinopolyspora limicola]|uniref:hypothetical protein n=1 Tax=Phytoactinopolyspora limicola TaxID=2715536 RepID=UPI001408A488|nr:hypothetical protein [Phytoactinopolyspora limicola]
MHNLPHHRYTSTAIRDGLYWVVHCNQHPAARSRVRLLVQAVRHQRHAIASILGVPEAHVSVDVQPVLPPIVEQHLGRARQLRRDAADANRAAAAESRAAARALAAQQLSLRDIGTILGVSHQRVHQLIKS